MVDSVTRLRDLVVLSMRPPLEIIEYLQEKNLIGKSYVCPKCNVDMIMKKRLEVCDMYCWRCSKCGLRRSIRKGSWFEFTKLPFSDVLMLTYMWLRKQSQVEIMHELNIKSNKTVIDWFNYCRIVCSEVLRHHNDLVDDSDAIEEDSAFGTKRKFKQDQSKRVELTYRTKRKDADCLFLQFLRDVTEIYPPLTSDVPKQENNF